LSQELGEVHHGVAAAGDVLRWVDGELLPAAVADDNVQVAPNGAVVPVEVNISWRESWLVCLVLLLNFLLSEKSKANQTHWLASQSCFLSKLLFL